MGRVLHAADELVDELNRIGPTLWVVDDLHWSDVTSRDVLAYLIGGLDAQRLGLVLLVRAEERTEGHPVNVWLADLRRDPARSRPGHSASQRRGDRGTGGGAVRHASLLRPRPAHPPAHGRQPLLHGALR